jgi:methionyl-tRNA synthetase
VSETYYVTTPIYYVNAEPHLGHLYTTLVADTLRRFHRQCGRDVFMLTGTDEHSQKIERAAAERGVPTIQHVDQLAAVFRSVFDRWDVRYDRFVRTTDDYHKRGAQELWRRCRDAGHIYTGEYEGWYCVPDNAFVDGEKDADPAPLCHECGGPTEWIAEPTYFFRLSAFQDRLLDYYREHPGFIQPPARRNEIVSFVEGGLRDLSISRVSSSWGVPVPDDPDHVMYVWFDALSNYITAIGFGNELVADWRFWPADAHLIGKDIARFHCVYWPAFLMGAGLELPKSVRVHGMWLSGGRRMSKRLGNGIAIELLEKHFSRDAVRYFCLSEMVFGQDGEFTYETLIDRSNADLANGLGNLSSRALTMLHKYFDGALPVASADSEVLAVVAAAAATFVRAFEGYEFRTGIEAAREAIGAVDRYISANRPWALAADPGQRERLATVLVTVTEALRAFAVILAPVLPDATASIWRQLGLEGEPSAIDPRHVDAGTLAPAHRVQAVSPVFPRLDKEKIMADINAERSREQAAESTRAPAAAAEGRGYITIDDFAKVELRVGEVLEAARIEGADKLLRLQVDVGEPEPRQVLAGIAMYYEPEKLVGRKIVIVTNLAPRKMRGLMSNGMLLAASVGEEGRPVLATFTDDVPNGARLK